MKPIATILITFSLAATAFAQDKPKAAAGGAPAAKPKTYTGIISDSMCLNKHMWKAMGATDDADCVRKCVGANVDYILLVGKEPKDYYILKGNTADFSKYAAQKVTVKGTLKDDMLTAESVAPAAAAPTKIGPKHKGKKAAS